MNCVVCGKTHSKDQPLILVDEKAFCSDCLIETETKERYTANGFVESETCPGLYFAVDDYDQMHWKPITPTAFELLWAQQQTELQQNLITMFQIPPQLIQEIKDHAR